MKSRRNIIAALDVGSTKVCCFIGQFERELQITGFGHHASKGIRGGTIVDMEAAAASVASAVQDAEQMAGETVKSVFANVSGDRFPPSGLPPGGRAGFLELGRPPMLAPESNPNPGKEALLSPAPPPGDGASGGLGTGALPVCSVGSGTWRAWPAVFGGPGSGLSRGFSCAGHAVLLVVAIRVGSGFRAG